MTSHHLQTVTTNHVAEILVHRSLYPWRTGVSHTLSDAIAYSSTGRLDKTTATLRLLALCGYSLHLLNNTLAGNLLLESVNSINSNPIDSVCLLAMTRSNTLNIAVNHRLIIWGATFRCCQMCWLLVVFLLMYCMLLSCLSVIFTILLLSMVHGVWFKMIRNDEIATLIAIMFSMDHGTWYNESSCFTVCL